MSPSILKMHTNEENWTPSSIGFTTKTRFKDLMRENYKDKSLALFTVKGNEY